MNNDLRRFPGHWEICATCNGHGKHVNPAVDGHGISREEFDEDPDFEEAYFSGVYDVTCEDCGGSGKDWVVDITRCTFAQKRELVELGKQIKAAREVDEMMLAERRYCYGY